MSDSDMFDAARAAGSPIEQAVAVFMLHPDTFAESIEAGYEHPFAGYVAGRAGVLGETTGVTVHSVFAVFEPNFIHGMWETGIAVRGAIGAAELYWDQVAGFARKYLAAATGLDRIAALGEKIIAATPDAGLPLYAGWRTMALVDDAAARALQVMFVLRELRAGVHFNALTDRPPPKAWSTWSPIVATCTKSSSGSKSARRVAPAPISSRRPCAPLACRSSGAASAPYPNATSATTFPGSPKPSPRANSRSVPRRCH
ncbi:helix-turn-helix domain-containing protein [Mycobacterium ulcerans]|uniref:helix-turn-helix domain-containing protein n=1 Tax=Mycobacterium ulcerans TaxID=1809 RepID=UPI00214B57E0|nr:hypothetical protein [Mycobacterium ulcerans]